MKLPYLVFLKSIAEISYQMKRRNFGGLPAPARNNGCLPLNDGNQRRFNSWVQAFVLLETVNFTVHTPALGMFKRPPTDGGRVRRDVAIGKSQRNAHQKRVGRVDSGRGAIPTRVDNARE